MDALIVALIARIDALVAENTALRTRVAELEAKLGLPAVSVSLRLFILPSPYRWWLGPR